MTIRLELRSQHNDSLAIVIEEQLWTLPGIQAVEQVVTVPGQWVVYADSAADWLKLLQQHCPQMQLLSVIELQEEDWAEHWKQYWHVTPVSQRLTIVPSWLTYDAQQANEIVLRLDPGAAFGTGTHETTRLMLRALDALDQSRPLRQQSLLDVGTGSGILAIAAARLGCQSVTGQDIDPTVLPVAVRNAGLSNTPWIYWTDTPLAELCLTRYDIIVANILAPVLIDLLPDLEKRLATDGVLLLGGVIDVAEADLRRALGEQALTVQSVDREGAWIHLTAVKTRSFSKLRS